MYLLIIFFKFIAVEIIIDSNLINTIQLLKELFPTLFKFIENIFRFDSQQLMIFEIQRIQRNPMKHSSWLFEMFLCVL